MSAFSSIETPIIETMENMESLITETMETLVIKTKENVETLVAEALEKEIPIIEETEIPIIEKIEKIETIEIENLIIEKTEIFSDIQPKDLDIKEILGIEDDIKNNIKNDIKDDIKYENILIMPDTKLIIENTEAPETLETEVPVTEMPSINNTENTETLETEILVTEIQTDVIKPYRASKYDKYDTMYSTKLNINFYKLEDEIKKHFNDFTNNLMDEKQINRNSLLDAVDEFQNNEKYKYLNLDKNQNYEWVNFTNDAFNYRPYQPCIVM